jgi:hypothetical protein
MAHLDLQNPLADFFFRKMESEAPASAYPLADK